MSCAPAQFATGDVVIGAVDPLVVGIACGIGLAIFVVIVWRRARGRRVCRCNWVSGVDQRGRCTVCGKRRHDGTANGCGGGWFGSPGGEDWGDGCAAGGGGGDGGAGGD